MVSVYPFFSEHNTTRDTSEFNSIGTGIKTGCNRLGKKNIEILQLGFFCCFHYLKNEEGKPIY